jgi:hypothetical protein
MTTKWKFEIIAYWKNSINDEQNYSEDNQPFRLCTPFLMWYGSAHH